jgi:peptidoglycan/LPS O-acetylase OafA/YrhL
LWDSLGIYLHQAPMMYEGLNHNNLTPDVRQALSLKSFIGNVAYLWVLLGAVQEAKRTLGTRLSRSVARFSYTLYVAHTPFLILLVSITAHDTRWIPSASKLVISSVVLVVILLYAWLVAVATEFNTAYIRSWIERKLLSMPEESLDRNCTRR